ncbi:hypothetical protein [Herbaspirillum hiltneri]|uniref:hypothetical protein n=1 Tax=Herbaspirillum hiltneri TaxID=341045 RepID=UPI001F35A99D|nr:hypothetical protein [Herbaspirillum hiltneri]
MVDISISGGAWVMAVGESETGGACREGAAGLGLARATCFGCGVGFLTGLAFGCGGSGCLATGLGGLWTNVTSSGSWEELAWVSIFCRLGRKTKNSTT